MSILEILEISIAFFLVANPFGNSPAIIALIKDFDFATQKKIMLRESLLALCLALFFQYFGKMFLEQLEVSLYTLRLAGGILLLLVALDMIFYTPPEKTDGPLKKEPLFVPIATPLITGPALLTIIMVYATQMNDNFKVSLALCITWVAVTSGLIAAPYLNKILKKRGLIALEQLMGLFLTMLAVGMITQGITEFVQAMENY